MTPFGVMENHSTHADAIGKESSRRLKFVCEIKTGLEDADFWLQRRGSTKTIGRPTRDYSRDNIGIKITSRDVVPTFLWYAMEHLFVSGHWEPFAIGTTNLKNLRLDDVKNVKVGI